MDTSKFNTTIHPKLVGETKHYPPAVKEWKDSVYTYNKNYLKNSPSRNAMLYKIIKNYFSLNDCKHLARSKRMRSLIRKTSASKILINKPELKQTNDNVNITIHTYDSERQIFLRKIYHNIRKWENKRNTQGIPHIYNSYDYWRNKYNLNKYLAKLENNSAMISKIKVRNTNLLLKKYISLKKKHTFSINRLHYLKTRSNMYILRKKRKNVSFKNSTLIISRGIIKNKRGNIPYFGIKSLNEAKFLRYISQFKSNSIKNRKLIYYFYIKHILSLLGIKVLNFDMINNGIHSIKDGDKIAHIQEFKNLRGKILLYFGTDKKSSVKPEILSINNVQMNIPYQDKVNLVLSNFVSKILNNNDLIRNENLSLANFSKTNFKEFMLEEKMQNLHYLNDNSYLGLNKTKFDYLKKEISLVKDYINLKINNFKFNKYLPALKLLISKVYNKNVQLNIVKLKYLYLNSDIFTEAISMQLKKKISSLKIMKKSFKLVETPNEFNEITSSVNNIKSLNIYKSLKLENLFMSNKIKHNTTDDLDLIINNVYPYSLINQTAKNKSIQQGNNKNIEYSSNKLINVINVIKYKWVTGVKLEVAGRLTRRYTAERSVYKYRYKGSLKNTDFSRKLDFLKKSMPVIMFRNNAKTNSQYSFAKSKRRIGAFGIKGWISSY